MSEDIKYIIRRKDNGLHAQWYFDSEDEYKTVLFDSTEEVNRYMEEHYYFFENIDYEIVPVTKSEREGIRLSYIAYCNFKDIKDTEEYKESICYKA